MLNKMYFKLKLLISQYNKVQFLKDSLETLKDSLFRNSHKSVLPLNRLKWLFISLNIWKYSCCFFASTIILLRIEVHFKCTYSTFKCTSFSRRWTLTRESFLALNAHFSQVMLAVIIFMNEGEQKNICAVG